jgi:hypothetical protein
MSATPPAPALSLVFLTYNRSDLLARAFDAIVPPLAAQLPGGLETIISDDHSNAAHQAVIRGLGATHVLVAPRNRGLGNNHNKALAACTATYVLSLQDDWLFTGTVATIRAAMGILERDADVGIVEFLPPSVPIPCERRRTPDGVGYDVYVNDALPHPRASGSRPYSDRPHLKTRAFIDDLGPYREDLPMTTSELDFQQRVACQARWRVAWIDAPPAFEHLGAERSFNPGQRRAERLARLEALPLLGNAMRLLRPRLRRWLRRQARD